jgi:hypothetical protein
VVIGYVTLSGRGRIDRCLAEAVDALTTDGIALAGTVVAEPPERDGHPCDMSVRVLPFGRVLRISQALGSGSVGCRLDPSAIEELAAEVDARLPGADLLIVNKFGKQEAQGRGMCSVITRAVDLGIPVLVGVNGLNMQPFLDFAAGYATLLPAESGAILRWARAVAGRRGLSAA